MRENESKLVNIFFSLISHLCEETNIIIEGRYSINIVIEYVLANFQFFRSLIKQFKRTWIVVGSFKPYELIKSNSILIKFQFWTFWLYDRLLQQSDKKRSSSVTVKVVCTNSMAYGARNFNVPFTRANFYI